MGGAQEPKRARLCAGGKTLRQVRPNSANVGALRGLGQRTLAGARSLLVNDDAGARPVLRREGGVPARGKLRIGPAEERLRVPRSKVHAAVALHVAEDRVPERAVERVAAVEV